MQELSEIQLSLLTGKTRNTIRKKLGEMKSKPGPHRARLYPSGPALELIYCGTAGTGDKTGFVPAAEAARLLTVARKDQIELEMEVTRKERILLDDLEETNDRVFSNLAGMLKANRGKELTDDLVKDMLQEARNVGVALTDAG